MKSEEIWNSYYDGDEWIYSYIKFGDFNKTWFLAREEAEKKLENLKY